MNDQITAQDKIQVSGNNKFYWLEHSQDSVILKIPSTLMDREEEFKLVALSMVTSLPLLLIGDPGIAKSQVVEEFADKLMEKGGKIFKYQVDDYTHPSEIKGKPDMKAFFDKENPRYTIECPVEDVDFIFIDEIHNANSGYKNAIFSILSEHAIYVGKNKINLPYKAFVATANDFPRTEKSKAFYDRFIFKHRVSRLPIGRLVEYLSNGHKEKIYTYELTIPGSTLMDQPIDLPMYKVGMLVSTIHSPCSDRTIMNIPRIVKAIVHIWKISVDEAIIKATGLLAGMNAAKELSDQLNSKECNAINSKIEILKGINDNLLIEEMVKEISVLLSAYQAGGNLMEEQVVAFKVAINVILGRKKCLVRIE